MSTASNSGRGEITEEKSQVKNEGTGEEETEDRTRTKKEKKKRQWPRKGIRRSHPQTHGGMQR